MNRVVVAAGSNIDPDQNIAEARRILSSKYRLLSESAFVKTAPIGFADQPDFRNGAFLVETGCGRREFNRALKKIEQRLGRVRTANKFGPRTIDLDIVAWNGKIVGRDFHARDFVRNAALELMPELRGKNRKR
jgi:2-amino-4-hydroxy-6-hydroxymethyldihydropteridine diphosphokinase